jgi:hypothetical protein
MKQGMSLQQMAAQVIDNSEKAMDYVVPVKNMEFHITENGIQYMAGVQHHGMISGDMTPYALRQAQTNLGVPAKFADVLMTEDRPLLEHIMNERAHSSDDNRMLRTIDNKIVGNVSPSFSRLYDNDTILKALLPSITGEEFEVKTCNLNDQMMHLSVMTPKLRGEVKVGDVVQGGIRARNSGVGASRMFFARLAERLWCLNGCTNSEIVDSYTRIHRGGRQPLGILMADDTLAAHQTAIALEIRDTIHQLLSPEIFEQEIQLMRDTTERRIEGDVVKAIEELGKIVSYTKDEGSQILKHLIEGGDLTQWGMLNAVTRYAQDVDDYDRSMQMEAIGGKVLTLKPNQWNVVKEAA